MSMPRKPVLAVSRLAAAAAGLLMVFASAGCSGSSTPKSGAAGDPASPDLGSVTLRIGATGWSEYAAALQVAGLQNTPYHITWSVFSTADAQLQALSAGALDVADSSDIPPVYAAVGGKPRFTVVAVQKSNTQLQDLMVGKGSTITSVAQLKGKKVGYVPNSSAQYYLDGLLKKAGLSWSDIQAAPLNPNEGVAALQGGSIAALATYGQSVITAQVNGSRILADGATVLPADWPWEVNATVLGNAGDRAALVDLLVRLNKAFAYIRDGHFQAYAQAASDATHEPLPDALAQLQAGEQQIPTRFVPTSSTEIGTEQQVADTFYSIGATPNQVSVAGFWSDTLDSALTAQLQADKLPMT